MGRKKGKKNRQLEQERVSVLSKDIKKGGERVKKGGERVKKEGERVEKEGESESENGEWEPNEQDLQKTVETLEYLSRNLPMYRSVQLRTLRKTIYPLFQERLRNQGKATLI